VSLMSVTNQPPLLLSIAGAWTMRACVCAMIDTLVCSAVVRDSVFLVHQGGGGELR
jgi:hypothetical protein